jgi:hypothetical protein
MRDKPALVWANGASCLLGSAGPMLLWFILPLTALLRSVLHHREEVPVASANENLERREKDRPDE